MECESGQKFVKDSCAHINEGIRSTSTSFIAGLQSGNEVAWDRLVRLYTPLVDYWLRKGGLQLADVEDVRQEVFIAVRRGIEEFEPDGNGGAFRRWLYAIARHRLMQSKRTAEGLPLSMPEHELRSLRQMRYDPTVEAVANAPEALAILHQQALELLRLDFENPTWQAFWEVFVQGRTPADVAAQLGVSPNAVYIAKARVLSRFREQYGGLIRTEAEDHAPTRNGKVD